MNMHLFRRTNLLLAAALSGLVGLAIAAPVSSVTAASSVVAELSDTQDIIHMRDGRVLTGKIVSEDSRQIVFRYVDPTLNLQTTITLQRRDIIEVERDVPVRGGGRDDDADFDDVIDLPSDDGPVGRSRPQGLARGVAEGAADDESLPSFYVIPMKGQMGTDIHPDIYRQIIDDIRSHRPDRIVWVMNCSDQEELIMPIPEQFNPEQGIPMLDEYRQLVQLLRDQLRDIPQVMWVEDSHGISSLLALAWDNVYMSPNARLSGLGRLYAGPDRFQNPDVRAKMMAAHLAMISSFLERSNRPLAIAEAMVVPERTLSASWRGRRVEWHLNVSGEYVVNASDKRTANFTAKTAEELGISNGTIETLDDLALLEGFREYRVIEGSADQIVTRYVENWRRAFENAQTSWRDYAQHMGWATGDQTVRYLGRARNDLARIISLMRRYKAVETRMGMHFGLSLFQLEVMEEDLRERIRVARRAGGGGRGGGGGGGGGGTRGPSGI